MQIGQFVTLATNDSSMKKFIVFAALALISQACVTGVEGNGIVKKETREAAPFDKIEVDGAFDIFIRPGNYSAVTVNTDENLLEYIETYVKGGELHISSTKKLGHYEKLEIYLTMNEFNGADLSGACEIQSSGLLTGKNVELDFSGAVEVDLEIECSDLDADMSGACELSLKGKAKTASFEISGAGEVNAEDFETEECRIDMSGAGDAKVFVTKKLDIDISGAAEIYYKGNPGEINRSVSGAATIKPL